VATRLLPKKAPNTSTHTQETDPRVASGVERGDSLGYLSARRLRGESRPLWPSYAPARRIPRAA